jgi:hypothetical protein
VECFAWSDPLLFRPTTVWRDALARATLAGLSIVDAASPEDEFFFGRSAWGAESTPWPVVHVLFRDSAFAVASCAANALARSPAYKVPAGMGPLHLLVCIEDLAEVSDAIAHLLISQQTTSMHMRLRDEPHNPADGAGAAHAGSKRRRTEGRQVLLQVRRCKRGVPRILSLSFLPASASL